jgi:putative transcriptional regulator
VKSVKGSILIASPGLSDPNFLRTVVLVTEHNPDGAFGVVLNRKGKHAVAELWKGLTEEPTDCPAPTYLGGPVQPGAVFLLHRREDLAGGTEPVLPGLYLGGDVELLGKLIASDKSLRDEGREEEIFRVYCGYSGWGKGQLDRELKAGGWIVLPASTEFIFSTPPERLWQRTMEEVGGPYKFFSLMPQDPEMN